MDAQNKLHQTGGVHTALSFHFISLLFSSFSFIFTFHHHYSHLTAIYYSLQIQTPFIVSCSNSSKKSDFLKPSWFDFGGSMSTVSKDDNLALSSEDSSSPDESELELGLGLSLSHPAKYHHHHHGSYARIFTAKDFSSSSPSSAGTKRTADSLDVTNRPSQVVGWPPLRTYRVNSFNANAKSTEALTSVVEKSKNNNTVARKSADNGKDDNNINVKDKRNLRISPFVKVNMDGIPIGRKVDLSAHSSYKTLAETLEDMFDESTTGVTCKGSNGEDLNMTIRGEKLSILLDGSSKFVLTYEDKEGDWMLVGDVPWGMFLGSVKRLRIMRTSEANGLAPRLEEKSSRPKSKPK